MYQRQKIQHGCLSVMPLSSEHDENNEYSSEYGQSSRSGCLSSEVMNDERTSPLVPHPVVKRRWRPWNSRQTMLGSHSTPLDVATVAAILGVDPMDLRGAGGGLQNLRLDTRPLASLDSARFASAPRRKKQQNVAVTLATAAARQEVMRAYAGAIKEGKLIWPRNIGSECTVCGSSYTR